MASAVPVTAQMVGNAFVTQYYNVLHQLPHVVYRFYTDASWLTRAEAGPTGESQTARNQNEIHKLIMSTGHKDCRAEIMTVDALDSFGGSVFVLVTGAMHKNNSRRNFVQSFFLAPQDRGYYVLNDIFRYLDEDTQSVAPPLHKVSNGVLDMYERQQIASEAVPEVSDFSSSAIGEEAVAVEELEYLDHRVAVDVEQPGIEGGISFHTTEAVSSERLGPVQQPSIVDDVRSPSLEEMPAEKKSYASILRLQRDNHMSTQAAGAFHPGVANPEQSFSSYQQSSSSQLSSVHSAAQTKEESVPLENEVDLKAVYVKNLPANVTDLQLEDELKRFGPVRPSSISVRSNKDGGLYAFVDFEDSVSAQAAIEASPVLIGGRKAHIEERKSTYTGGRGRGRGQGRGTLQNNGLRARSTYSAGVSGRGSVLYGDGDALNRGRGARPVRSGYGGSSTKAFSSNDF